MRKLIPFLFIVFLSSCTSQQKGNTSRDSFNQTSHPSSSQIIQSQKATVDYFSSDIYGPFHVGDSDFDAKFTYRLDIENQKIYERMLICSISGDTYVSTNHTPFSYQNNASINTTFTIPIKNYLTENGLTLKFEILSYPDRKVLKSYSVSIYPCLQAGWTYEQYMRGLYITRNIGFYGNGKSLTGITEAYYFHHIGEYVDNEYYYRLDLENNYMNYDSIFKLSYDSINLKIADRDNLFPNFKHDKNKNINIPLKATVNDEAKVSFSIKNTLYVNESTLEMRGSYQKGYTPTRDFYFPINKREKLIGTRMYLEFVNYGKSKVNMTFPLQYIAGEPLVGNSGSAKYFVTGGVK